VTHSMGAETNSHAEPTNGTTSISAVGAQIFGALR
jgi:hypothetical protein